VISFAFFDIAVFVELRNCFFLGLGWLEDVVGLVLLELLLDFLDEVGEVVVDGLLFRDGQLEHLLLALYPLSQS
jgi:hypothetical protein